MKRVLFVISYLDKGGAERALSNITRNMPEEWEIDILVNNDNVIDYQYRGQIISLGINSKPKMSSILFQLCVLLRRIVVLRRMKRQNGYEACVSFLDSANIANILSGKRFCKTVVSVRCSLRGQKKDPCFKYVVNPLVRLLYNSADKVVAVSRGIKKELIKEFHISESKVCAIENGYDIDELIHKSKECVDSKLEDFIRDKMIIVTSGRLNEQKGQWHLIRAFSAVAKKNPNVRLVILGEGPLENELRKMVEEREINEQVYFTGYVHNPYSILARSDLFVMSSLFEGFPNALAEAICLGLPCIATDFPTGARELLAPDIVDQEKAICSIQHEKYGVLTPVCSGKRFDNEELEDAEVYLAEAITRLCEDDGMREMYATRSRERGIQMSISEVIKNWVGIIDESECNSTGL